MFSLLLDLNCAIYYGMKGKVLRVNPLKMLVLKGAPVFHVLFTMVWLNNLSSTDSLFSVYVLVAFASFYLRIRNVSSESKHRGWVIRLSLIFSVLILLANYPIFTQLRDPALIGRSTNLMVNLINTLFSFIGGISVSMPILQWWFDRDPVVKKELPLTEKRKWLPHAVFSFIFALNLVHLFLVEYPGNVTEDPFTQISEMVSGQYSNFNTFWHTMLFRLILSAGYAVSADVNVAVACFCVFQTAVMTFAFTHCLVTMDRCGASRGFLAASFLIFAIVPYNMALSITIWKDVLFAGGCLLMLSAWIRLLKKLDSNPLWNYVVFILGTLLFLLSRTNGWLIYLVTFLVAIPVLRGDRKLLASMGCLALLGWFLLNPALDMLHVSGGDLVESLSIPIQQVSRVIADGGELTAEEEELLFRVVDLEEVPDLYQNWISDPMKVEVRSKDYGYFQSNFSEYRDLWIRLGLRYPWEYVKAWVDQTRGYWNGGYDYAMYSETVTDNPYGVVKSGGSNPVASLFRLYFGLSRHVVFFEPLHSIGLHIWILLLCFLRNLINKREEWVLALPLVLLVLGLWFGTPVYACFRYAYPVFVCLPLILSVTVFSSR